MAYVYMLECRDGSFYVGLTRHDWLETGVGEHQNDTFDGYTAARRPVQLIWAQHYDRIVDAIAMERRLKGWSRAKKKALVRGDFDALPGLSRRPG
ncbi:MAG: GIY-YIG nuclease family protein [Hyphomicrobiales bacterium]|nr:GIY-YIG nuclease family protein [Hyphomicrobiales bacterium]